MENANGRTVNFEPPSPKTISPFLHFCETGNQNFPSIRSHFSELLSLALLWSLPEPREVLRRISNSENIDLKLLVQALEANTDTSAFEILV
jgi:hypothetical protein